MKKLFWLFTFILIWLINFWYCETITNYPITVQYTSTTSSATFQENTVWIHCFNMDQSWTPWKLTINWETTILNWYRNYCVKTTDTITLSVNNVNRLQYYHFFFPYETFIWVFFPQYTSLQCQTEYDLIPSSDLSEENCRIQFWLIPYDELDTICVSWWFCSSGGADCPVWTWDWNWSALYINNIQHLSAPIINVDIPEEFDWDYSNEDWQFNLDIYWYNVDTDYIDWIIRTQNYKPTSEDFTSLVQMLAPYSKYLIFLLFVVFVWAGVKNIFKSKKL